MTSHPFVHQLDQYLQQHHARDQLKISDVAQHFGVSRSTLHARCTKHTGMSVMKYANAYRIRRACTLLSTTFLQIKEIAFMVGFRDPNYFSRVFSREMGCSASEWRVTGHCSDSLQ